MVNFILDCPDKPGNDEVGARPGNNVEVRARQRRHKKPGFSARVRHGLGRDRRFCGL
jgi:hypothetical protein